MDVQKAALFALDAYNRETATVGVPYDAQVIASDVEGGFAAVAYYLAETNELVVSFRGTDNPSFFGFPVVDAITGWPIGNGIYNGFQSQADLAFAFYNDLKAIVSDPASSAFSAAWSFTGHSLGGGLAGLVASTKGLPAYVFDSMPFTEAANNLYADVSGPDAANHSYWSDLAYPDGVTGPPAFGQITSAAILDEVNTDLRYGTPFVVAGRDVILTSGLDAQVIQQNEIKAGTVDNFIDLHSQALLTIALRGGLSQSDVREAGGEAIYHHLFDASLASHLGFTDTEWLRQHLAYSIDDDIVALDSLFEDMDVLGTIVQSLEPNAHLQALGKLAIVHASQIASAGDSSLRLGLIEVMGDVANIALSGTTGATELIDDFIQFSSTVLNGQFFEIPTTSVANLAVSMSGYGGEVHLVSGGTMYFGTFYLDDIYGSQDDDVILSLGTDLAFYDIVRGGGGDDVIYASAGADTIHDGSGNDRSHGGGGNDTFHGGTGSDAMFGDAGNDTFHLGEALEGDVDYIDGGAGTDTVRLTESVTIRIDQTRVAEIRGMLEPTGLGAPTGSGFGIEYGAGLAFGQRIESLVAEADGNTLIGNLADGFTLSGITTFDFSASQGDEVILNGAHPSAPIITLSSANGVSQASAQSITFKGVETWTLEGAYFNSAAKTSQIILAASALTGAAVAIKAVGLLDMLNVSLLSTAQAGVTVSLLQPTQTFGAVTVEGIEAITGGVGADVLTGSHGANILIGGKGKDVIAGLGGSDTIQDEDWVVVDYSASSSGVTIVAGNSSYLGTGGDAEGDVISAGSRLDVIGSAGNDNLVGYEIWGGDGNDTIVGNIVHAGDGYDIVRVNDTWTTFIDFGSGGGELYLSEWSQPYDVDMQAGLYRMLNGNGTTFHNLTVLGDVNKVSGSRYNDVIRGTSGDDIIDGGANGVDQIYGRDGNDNLRARYGTVWGGEGDDTLTTGNGGATLIGGRGADTIVGNGYGTLSYAEAAEGVAFTMVNGSGTGTGGEALGDVIQNVHAIRASSHSDQITITMKDSSALYAAGGDDIIQVRHKTYSVVYGEDGNDVINILSLTGGQTYGGDGDDIISGGGKLYGEAGNDTLTGNSGADTLDGGSGNDTFEGRGGTDTILFGDGMDTFIFRTGDGKDTITGVGTDDTIRLVDILAFTSFGDVSERLQQVGSNVLLDFGRMSDHEDVYGEDAPNDWIGAIQFNGLTIAQLSALNWEFS